MKKLFSLLLSIVFITCLSTACNNDGDDSGVNSPVYAEEFSYNETHHWREQVNGNGRIEEGYHREENGGGRCEVCRMYFECEDLEFRKITLDGVDGYELYEYNDNPGAYLHVEVPAYYDGVDGLLPVLSIADHVFNADAGYNSIAIKSIKLNEGLKRIGLDCFSYTSFKELIIPNSVVGYLRHVTVNCIELERVVIGDGVEDLRGSNFSGCISLKEIKFGSSVKRVEMRNFYAVTDVEYVVLPKSLECILEEEIYVSSSNHYYKLNNLFEGCSPIFYLEITKDEHDLLIHEPRLRDPIDNKLLDEDYTYGWCEGWSGNSKVYFKGEWHYDENGKPVKNV